ncbi:hypothetical protein CJF42_01755 [Pseudoalteromonas sp. NBT06-2]|uniref:tetratricopeptide repeat protein n=1 Tax=Pseudoalteromonas sp. NBT06-2 TaxID=2025950 RepID=UPI000BA6E5E2|nr:tetratricopeptide repeat protein [Pseudoalteromonas sp. NBT06-2]PAJ75989.1 hypothetical protein CJF42_01755 [Pseudoalteromonas sp. NBT06-2]
MSVINKMLKDIEQRELNTSVYLDPTVKVESVRDNRQLFQRIGLILIAMSVAIGAYWFIPSKNNPAEPTSIAQTDKIEPSKLKQITAEKQNATLDKNNRLQEVKEESLKMANERIKMLEVDLAKTESTPVAQIEKPLISYELTKKQEKKSVKLAKKIKNTPAKNTIQNKPKAVAKIRKISTRARAENWFVQGKEAFQFGLIEDAISALDKALILMPLHIEARSLLTAAYYGREQTQEAESILRHGLTLNPDVMRWRILLAKILVEQGSYQSVAPVLSKRYEVSANVDFWILKGTASQQLGEHKVAKHCFSKLTQLEPSEAKWWLALAASNDALGHLHNAKRFYLTAIELGGLSPNAHNHAKKRLEKIGLL